MSAEESAHEAAPDAELALMHARVGRYLRFLGCDGNTVDDLVQDAMLAAARNFPGARAPWPWLLATSRNMLWQHHRKRGRQREIADLERLHERYCEQIRQDGGDAQLEALRECLRSLPKRSRRVIELRYRDGLSRQAIADEVGIGMEGIKSLLTKTREQLGQCIRRRIADEQR